MLAQHWAFTEEQIKAIEHQYNGLCTRWLKINENLGDEHVCLGPSSFKEHGFRMLLIWSSGLAPDVNPVRELYESLAAVGKKAVAGE